MSDPMPTIYNIIGWDEIVHGPWDKEQQRYEDGTKSDGHGTDDR